LPKSEARFTATSRATIWKEYRREDGFSQDKKVSKIHGCARGGHGSCLRARSVEGIVRRQIRVVNRGKVSITSALSPAFSPRRERPEIFTRNAPMNRGEDISVGRPPLTPALSPEEREIEARPPVIA